jgi:hypothetical protein
MPLMYEALRGTHVDPGSLFPTISAVTSADQQVLSSWVAASPASTPSVLHQLDVLCSVMPEDFQIWLVDAMR